VGSGGYVNLRYTVRCMLGSRIVARCSRSQLSSEYLPPVSALAMPCDPGSHTSVESRREIALSESLDWSLRRLRKRISKCAV
jgi:hypothetical protein